MEMVLKVITKRYPVNRKKRYACLQRYAKLEERGMKTMRQNGSLPVRYSYWLGSLPAAADHPSSNFP